MMGSMGGFLLYTGVCSTVIDVFFRNHRAIDKFLFDSPRLCSASFRGSFAYVVPRYSTRLAPENWTTRSCATSASILFLTTFISSITSVDLFD